MRHSSSFSSSPSLKLCCYDCIGTEGEQEWRGMIYYYATTIVPSLLVIWSNPIPVGVVGLVAIGVGVGVGIPCASPVP